METFSEVSGAKVICAESGETVGSVESVVCIGNAQVLGLILYLGKIGNRYGFIYVEDILTAEPGEIRIFNRESIQKSRPLIRQCRKHGRWNWLNKKAVTPEGKLLGTVSDGVFDVHSGKISQVELSLGVIEDFRDGRRRFSLGEDTEFGQEFLVLKNGGKEHE